MPSVALKLMSAPAVVETGAVVAMTYSLPFGLDGRFPLDVDAGRRQGLEREPYPAPSAPLSAAGLSRASWEPLRARRPMVIGVFFARCASKPKIPFKNVALMCSAMM